MRQSSLSAYFEALWWLTHSNRPVLDGTTSVFFPVRRFDKESLVLGDGSTLLERLCAITALVVIEDVDLSAPLLAAHLEGCGLTGLAASDAADGQRMHSAHLLCVARRELSACLPGRRIW